MGRRSIAPDGASALFLTHPKQTVRVGPYLLFVDAREPPKSRACELTAAVLFAMGGGPSPLRERSHQKNMASTRAQDRLDQACEPQVR